MTDRCIVCNKLRPTKYNGRIPHDISIRYKLCSSCMWDLYYDLNIIDALEFVARDDEVFRRDIYSRRRELVKKLLYLVQDPNSEY